MAIKMSEKEREGFDVLKAEMPESLAMEVVEYRRERKAKITARIARALVREYKAFGDIEKAIEQQMVRNWIGFEASWIKKPGAFTDTNNPSAKTETREEYIRRAIEQNKREWEGNDMARKTAQLVRGMVQ